MNQLPAPPLTRAQACVASLRTLGVEGPFANTTLIGSAMLGLRITRPGAVVVSDLWVSPSSRGRGLGRRLLTQVCAYADFHQVPLRLRPCAFDRQRGGACPPTTPQLRRWYLAHGFAPHGQLWMVRAPQPFPAEQRRAA